MITEYGIKKNKGHTRLTYFSQRKRTIKKNIQICTSLHEVDQVLSKRWHYTDKIYKHNNI